MEKNGNNRQINRPLIGLALGGGMARGCAHIGVLRILEKHHIPIDLIAGTSVGSLIGGAYAAGLTPDQIEALAMKITWNDLGRMTISRLGFYDSKRTEDFIRANFPITEFEKTRLPFGAVATDLQMGKMVVFTEGSLPLAIRASCAMPVFYTPVMVNGRMMVDGGLVGHLPASVARLMGADIVIAVDVNSQHLPIPQPTHMFTVMTQAISIMGRSTVGYLYSDADIVIRPQIEDFRHDDLSRAIDLIKAGEDAASKVIPKLKRILNPPRQGFLKRIFSKEEHDRRRVTMLNEK
jgi:NTE family protein